MDNTDKQILQCLQEDATMPCAEISKRVNLSTTPCWRRIQKLKKTGVIQREVALLDKEHLNLDLTVFIAVRTNQHSLEWLKQFASAIVDIPEIVECYRMAGEVDYLLRAVIPDVKSYDIVYEKLIKSIELYDVTSTFVMEELKCSTVLPLDYV